MGRLELPGDIHEIYDYDNLGRLDVMSNVFVVNGSDGDMLLARYDYDVRGDGKRTELVEEFWFDGSAGQPADGIQQPEELQQTTTEWTYDSLGRLVDEAIDHWDDNVDQTESYTYDLTGNRTKVARLSEAAANPTALTAADYDQVTAYTYDANDRLLEEVLDDLVDDSNDTTTTYGYDHTQQTRKTTFSGLPNALGSKRTEQSFTYNLQGRLASAVLDSYDAAGILETRQRSSYEYDHGSFRVGQLVENWNESTSQFDFVSDTEFLVDHNNHTGYAQTLRETTKDASGTVTKQVDYTFGHDELTQTITENGQSTTHVFGHDGHGSVRVLYDIAATADSLIEAVASYSAYGVLLATHTSDGTLSPATFDLLTSLTYSGEAWDSVLKRGYNRARWYDAASAQWNRLDPFAGNMQDPQSLQKYAYVHGDPANGIDPSGLFAAAASVASISVGNSLSTTYNDAVVGVGQDIVSGLLGQQAFLDPFAIAVSALLNSIAHAIDFFGGMRAEALQLLEAGIFVESQSGTQYGRVTEQAALSWASSGINGPVSLESDPNTSSGTVSAVAASKAFRVTKAARSLMKGVSRAKYPVQLVLKSGKKKIYVAGHSMLGKFNKATGINSALYQRNHLSQHAAFRDLGPQGGIPYGQGLTINLRGSVADGLDHFKFHKHMDDWWKQFGSSKKPSVGQYNRELTKALKKSGYTATEAQKITSLARQQQKAYGITEATVFKHIPKPVTS